MSPDDAWSLSPQEWWMCWSFKYGKRAAIIRGDALPDHEAENMRAELDEAIRKEKDG